MNSALDESVSDLFGVKLKARLHYQSFLVQENLVKVFDANFDSVNGQRKLWSKSIKELGRTLME